MISHRVLSILFFCLAVQAHAHLPTTPGCENIEETFARADCRGKQIDAANSKLREYLNAARVQAKLSDLDIAALDAEQAAWEAYRTKHCGNVYELWSDGTIRYEMSAICTLAVTKERTMDIWRAYLNYIDSTPAVLPDPSQ